MTSTPIASTPIASTPKHDDLVSVLMPAFKPQHFKLALLSVVNQSHENIEILVGDNSGHADIQAVIDEVGDERVVRIPNYQVTDRSPRLNHMILWHRAKGRYVRFVYDDDLVYERSTAVLLAQLKKVPHCVLSWHQREIIDEHGNVRVRHGVLPEDSNVVLDRTLLLDNMAKFLNFVGEPSFTMFDRDAIEHFGFNRYARFDTAFLWDIVMYLSVAKSGLAAGCGEYLGGFRVHSGQVSSAANVFGAVEWELVFRNELCEGNLTQSQFDTVLPKLLGLYQANKAALPVLEGFQTRLVVDAHTGRLRDTMPQFRAQYAALLQGRAA